MFNVLIYLLMTSVLYAKACNPNQNATSADAIRSYPIPSTTDNTIPSPSPTPTLEHQQNTTSNSIDKVVAGSDQQEHIICHKSENSSTKSYQHIIVSGLPFQRGWSHGWQAKEKILSMISFYKASSSMPSWNDCTNFVRNHYLNGLQQYYPNGLEEMKGIAEGAGVFLEDILILNSRYELTRWKRSEQMKNQHADPAKKVRASSELPECIQQNSLILNLTAETTKETEPASEDDLDDSGTDECTGAVALSSSTKYAHVLLGQNWDTSEFILTNDTAILLEVHPDPCENIKPFVMLTEAGQLGRSGMNAGNIIILLTLRFQMKNMCNGMCAMEIPDGLGIVGMSLWSSADLFQNPSKKRWIPSTLVRRMFLESPNFSIGLRSILRAPVHVSVNMIIATSEDEALNIELTPVGHFTSHVPLEKEIFTHSNHFKSATFVASNDIREGSRGSTSLFRDRRVEKQLLKAWPRITEETFQTAFKDHVGYPNSVCEHAVSDEQAWTSISPKDTTVASIIFNLNQRTLQLATGPPCTESYKSYCFKFSQL